MRTVRPFRGQFRGIRLATAVVLQSGGMDKQAEKVKLADATVSLLRDVELKFSPTESSVGDHMTVQHVTGNKEDVIITRADGTLKIKRLVMHMDISSSTPAVPSVAAFHFSLADLAEADEKRLLTIYEMFPKHAA
jgi:hypothetical protein